MDFDVRRLILLNSGSCPALTRSLLVKLTLGLICLTNILEFVCLESLHHLLTHTTRPRNHSICISSSHQSFKLVILILTVCLSFLLYLSLLLFCLLCFSHLLLLSSNPERIFNLLSDFPFIQIQDVVDVKFRFNRFEGILVR